MNLRELRLKSGLTQIDMAKRLRVTQGHVSLIENGYRTPSDEVVQEYQDAASSGRPRITKLVEQSLRKRAKHMIADIPAAQLETVIAFLSEF